LALAASAFWISFSASASVFSAGANPRQGTAHAWDRGQGAQNVPSSTTGCLGPFAASSFAFLARARFIAIAAAALPGILSAAGPAQH
jgi:hypothetical protein